MPIFNHTPYEREHFKRTEARAKAVSRFYGSAIDSLTKLINRVSANTDKPFVFADYPAINAQANAVIQQLYSNLYVNARNGVADEWNFANAKNDDLVSTVFGSKNGFEKSRFKRYFNRNEKALEQFISRESGIDGLDLSKRIWKYTNDQFRQEIEMALDIGISDGRSAAQLSRDVRGYLNEPDKLFRRVRDKRGSLQLSKNAQAYHPGQGNYRSSYKNAMRVTRTEVNMAYRAADHERWGQLDFVVGIEIKLSNNHPVTDICDDLKGRYPKTFKFTGWHPQCRCHVISILCTDEEMDQLTDKILAGEDTGDFKSQNTVGGVPPEFNNWVDENTERGKGWKSQPYFIRDNFKNGRIEQGLKDGLKMQTLAQKPIKSDMSELNAEIKKVTSLKQLKELTQNELFKTGHTVKVSFPEKDIDLDTAKSYTKELASLCDRYNLEMPFMSFDTKQNKSYYGCVRALKQDGTQAKYTFQAHGKGLNVGKLVDKQRLNATANGKSLCDPDRLQVSTMVHEFGHMLWVEYNTGANATAFKSELSAIREQYHSELILLNKERKVEELQNIYLGTYASKNMAEFMAEAFQEYVNKKTPSKYAKLVGELVDKHYLK